MESRGRGLSILGTTFEAGRLAFESWGGLKKHWRNLTMLRDYIIATRNAGNRKNITSHMLSKPSLPRHAKITKNSFANTYFGQ